MSEHLTPSEALTAAIKTAGSQSALGRACGVSQTAVWKWVEKAGQISAEHALKAAEVTGVSAHDLRPDIYPRSKVRFLTGGQPVPPPEPLSGAVMAGYGKTQAALAQVPQRSCA